MVFVLFCFVLFFFFGSDFSSYSTYLLLTVFCVVYVCTDLNCMNTSTAGWLPVLTLVISDSQTSNPNIILLSKNIFVSPRESKAFYF